MNPLKQYFRRPAIQLKLPSGGKYWPEGSIDMPVTGELPVFPMTAIDELTTKTPDSLFNGTAIMEIIKSCIPAIKDPWKMPAMDLNAILIAIRTASSGSNLAIDSTCPKCTNEDTYQINLSGLLQTLKTVDYSQPLQLGSLAIYYKPLNYGKLNEVNMSQFNVQLMLNRIESATDDQEKMNLTSQTMREINENLFRLIAEGIEFIKLENEVVDNQEYILEFIRNTDKNTFNTIKDYGTNLRESGEIKPFKIKCSQCSNEYDQTVSMNATDFFV